MMAKILLVEDNEMVSRMISLRLQMRGHEVDIAVNGEQGVEQAMGGQYALVLMDSHMPVMDGHEAVENLRAQGYRGCIVAVTASAMSRDSQSAIDAGCNGFIAKPIGGDFEDLIAGYLEHGTSD